MSEAEVTATGADSGKAVSTPPVRDHVASDSETEVMDSHVEERHLRDTLPPWRWKLVMVSIPLAMIMNGYDVSNVANIQAPIYEAFGNIELLPFVPLGYAMGCIATTPLIRRVIEVYNMRVLIVGFYIIFIVSCAVSGSATRIHSVIIGRALTGLGNNGVYQMNLTFVALFCDPHEASRMAGLVGLCWAIGLIIGPLVGGGFAENHHLTWRWAFYINLPFLGALMLLAGFSWPNFEIKKGSKLSTKLAEIDWVGGLLHVAVTTLFLVALVLSGSQWHWNSAGPIATWVITGVLFILYVIQQRFALFTTKKNRIFPFKVLTHRTAGLAAMGAWCSGMVYATSLYYLPLFFAFTRGTSPIGSAVHILPFIGVFIGATIISSILLPKIRLYAAYYVLAGAFIIAGGALMTQIDSETSASRVMGYETLLGFGVGLIYSNSYSVANAALTNPEQRVDSAGLFNMASLGSIALALGLGGSLFQNLGFSFLSDALQGSGFSDHDIREALGGVKSPVLESSNPEIVRAVVSAVTDVLSRIFYIVVATGALCFLLGLAMKWERLDFVKVERPKGDSATDVEDGGPREKTSQSTA